MNEYPSIVAFMQNPWFKPGTPKEVIFRYKTDQEFHRRLLARTMSGGRLVQAFGNDLYDRIHWDNIAPAHADEPGGMSEVDMDHVEKVIVDQKPLLILTFGRLAETAIANSIHRNQTPCLHCHHPNARHKTMADLCEFAISVQTWIEKWRLR